MKKKAMALLLSFTLIISGNCTLFAEELRSDEPAAKADTITGFVPLPEDTNTMTFPADDRPSLSDLRSLMPETLSVYYNESVKAEPLPVTWEPVGEDYETSESYYFQFSPKWDEAVLLADDLDIYTDAPYISVFFTYEEETPEGDDSISLNSQALGASITSSQQASNQVQIYRFLTSEMGFNCAAACGVLANIQAESSFNPTATGDKGTSYGICQWHNTRWTDLKNYCNKNGLDWTTLNGQLYFLQYELKKSYPTILQGMKSRPNTAEDAYLCGAYWCEQFERPANAKQVGVTRGNLAMNTYFPKYSTGSYDGSYSSPTNPKEEEEKQIEPEKGTEYQASLVVNQKLDLTTYLNYQTYSAYEVTPAGYASATSKGILTAKKASGNTTVKVTGKVKKNGKWVYSSSSVVLTIVKPRFTQSRLDLIVSEYDNANNYLISDIAPDSWTSSNEKIAAIDESGQIIATGKGTAKITAVFGKESGYTAKYTFSVRVGIPALNKKSVSMLSGTTTSLSLKVFSKALNASFSSDDESVATVDDDGLVTALSAGTATITAEYNGQPYSCKITVKKPTISAKSMSLKTGAKKKITLRNTKLSPVEWYSDDLSVAYVDEDGYVHAEDPGETTIYTITGGCTDTCHVTVK